jgi:hypothetical protein
VIGGSRAVLDTYEKPGFVLAVALVKRIGEIYG